jgi:hypothetical protein
MREWLVVDGRMYVSGVADERTRRRAGTQSKAGVTYTQEQLPLYEPLNY